MVQNPLEAERAYDEVANRYDHHHVDAKSVAENRYVGRYLEARIRPGMRVVDLGCGTGLFLELCPVLPEDYLGLDISSGMLEQARRKYPQHRFSKGDMQVRNEPVADGSADLVVSLFGSVSYCDIAKVEAEIRRMLKPGGHYFLMFCSPLYVHRETYITRSTNLLIPYTKQDIDRVFHPDVLWGMSRVVDAMPKTTPSWLMDPLLAVEVATWGRVRQDGCFFINAWGHK